LTDEVKGVHLSAAAGREFDGHGYLANDCEMFVANDYEKPVAND
jgi:hypothetical protein